MCKGPGPRIDYKETRGPLCKMVGNFDWGYIFQRIKSWTGSTCGEPGRERSVHRGLTAARTEGARARRRAHRSTTSGRSGAPKLTGAGAKEREEHGELDSGLTRAWAAAWRTCDDGGAKRSQKLSGEGFQRGRGEEKGSVRCGLLRGSSGWFL
jgi:hypothetical protein